MLTRLSLISMGREMKQFIGILLYRFPHLTLLCPRRLLQKMFILPPPSPPWR